MYLTVSDDNVRRLSVLAAWSEQAFAEFEQLVETKVSHVRGRQAIHEAFASAKNVTESEAADVLEAILPLIVRYVGDGQSPAEVVSDAVSLL